MKLKIIKTLSETFAGGMIFAPKQGHKKRLSNLQAGCICGQ